jgi:hypothetical protein
MEYLRLDERFHRKNKDLLLHLKNLDVEERLTMVY